jgi:LPXTG-motif cell wall-anchored protein
MAIGGALAGPASAHDFAPKVLSVKCAAVNGRAEKVATIQVTNDWSTPMMYTSASLSGTQRGPVAPQATDTYTMVASATASGSVVETIEGIWPDDGTTVYHPVTIAWGADPCPPPATTPPTTNPCAPGTIPDNVTAGCVTSTTIPATPPITATPTTVPSSADDTTVPHSPSTPAAPPSSAPTTAAAPSTPRSAPTTTHPLPSTLPTTGSATSDLVAAALGVGFAGAVLVLITRRRSPS